MAKVLVKLTKSQVIDGAVWLEGSELDVDAKLAKKLVEAGEADYIKAAEKPKESKK